MTPGKLFLTIAKSLELLSREIDTLTNKELEQRLREIQKFWNCERPLILSTRN